MKKILSTLILTLIIVNSCLIVNASETCEIQGQDININAGETFAVDLSLTGNTGLAALSLTIEYDNDLLELKSVENGEVFDDSSLSISGNSKENPYKVNWVNVDLSDSNESGKLISFNFQSSAYCASQTSYLKLNVEQAFNSDFEDVEITTNDLAVNIKGSAKKVKGISLTPPTKTEYLVNESSDFSGLSVKAIYSDNSTADVTQYAQIKGFDSTTSGAKLITVSYKGFSTAFPVKIKSSENSFYLKTNTVKAVAGETIEIPMDILNNSGVCGVESKILFDSKNFSLLNVTNGDVFANNQMTAGGNKTKTPYTVFWENATATENIDKNGTLGVVNLKVNDTAKVGSYPVNVILNNAVDCNLNSVSTLDTEMLVNVFNKKYLFADASGDGLVNIRDATIIQKHLIGADVSIDLDAAECEDDDVISVLDATKIQRLTVNLITDERTNTYIYI